MLLDRDPLLAGALWAELAEAARWTGPGGVAMHALAAVDVALHDLAGKQLGRPAYHLLGGARRPVLTPYATCWVGALGRLTMARLLEDTLALMAAAVAAGFRAVKMELLFGNAATDRDLVACIAEGRRLVGEDVELLVDFGYRWSDWRDALWVLRRAEPHRLYLAEAPLRYDDLEGHARLAERVETRVGGAELAGSLAECRTWLEVGRVDVLQPDVGRAGGLTHLRRIAELAELYGVSVIPHCWRTGINAAASRHLHAALPNVPMVEFLAPGFPRRHCGLLGAIYEAAFLGFSYGFRPVHGPHDALDALVVGIERKKPMLQSPWSRSESGFRVPQDRIARRRGSGSGSRDMSNVASTCRNAAGPPPGTGREDASSSRKEARVVSR